MDEFIEINYISPISNYKFANINKYYLVIINSTRDNSIFINKIHLENIKNVSVDIRSYNINKAITLISQERYPICSIKLFENDTINNTIKLLFSGNIDTNFIEYNGIKTIILFSPSNVLNCERECIFENDISFVSEQFFNFETINKDSKCILFITKLKNTDKQIIKPFIYQFDISPNIFIYDRYQQNVIREILNIQEQYYILNSLCKTNTYSDYIQFIKIFQIDVNKYTDNKNFKNNSFKEMFMRRINPIYRKIHFDSYLNNVILSPTDGRISTFDITKKFKFSYYNYIFGIDDLIYKSNEILNGKGFKNRMIPSDYSRIFLPYSGNLTNIGIFGNDKNKPYMITMRFESDYFIPNDVHEREYLSVIYGNNINVSRGYPELVEKQPNTCLVFYLILLGNNLVDSIIFTNNKLLNMTKIITLNTNYKMNFMWFEQGEEIGTFNCCIGQTLFMINRFIQFTSDIRFYSKIDEDSKLKKPIETYIKAKDIIGLIL